MAVDGPAQQGIPLGLRCGDGLAEMTVWILLGGRYKLWWWGDLVRPVSEVLALSRVIPRIGRE